MFFFLQFAQHGSHKKVTLLLFYKVSVVTMLLEIVGGWLPPTMRTLKDGMWTFPQAFIRDAADPYSLENDIYYGIIVSKVKWKQPGKDECSYQVKVCGRQTQTGNEIDLEADAVILTVQLNVLRQLEFRPDLPQQLQDAIGSIRYEPAIKVFLGFQERFWEKGLLPIVNGGISLTDLPISQIVYPSKKLSSETSEQGVLMLFFKNREALYFNSLSNDEIVAECLREVQNVYQGLLGENASKITELFKFGAVKSWCRDSYQGGWVNLLPYSYMNNFRALLEQKEIRPIFLGGDAISFENGWIQGALQSGLRSAWQFFKFNEYVFCHFMFTCSLFIFKKLKRVFVISTRKDIYYNTYHFVIRNQRTNGLCSKRRFYRS